MKEVKILKERSRVYKGTTYYKYKINLPETILMDAGFKAGDILELNASTGLIQVKKAEKQGN